MENKTFFFERSADKYEMRYLRDAQCLVIGFLFGFIMCFTWVKVQFVVPDTCVEVDYEEGNSGV